MSIFSIVLSVFFEAPMGSKYSTLFAGRFFYLLIRPSRPMCSLFEPQNSFLTTNENTTMQVLIVYKNSKFEIEFSMNPISSKVFLTL